MSTGRISYKGVGKRDRADPKWMREEKEAGRVLEARWGRQRLHVAGMKVHKMTTWITNTPEIAEELRGGTDEEGATGWKQVAQGLVRQMARDGRYGVCAVEPLAAEEVGEADTGIDRDPFEEAWGDASGKALDPKVVKKARED